MKSMVHLGHDLNLRVIAEGVETEQQLWHLQKEACDEIQGFFYYKPLPPDFDWKTLLAPKSSQLS
nr:EAL domain-containing protein [Oceanobacillus halotolerans]